MSCPVAAKNAGRAGSESFPPEPRLIFPKTLSGPQVARPSLRLRSAGVNGVILTKSRKSRDFRKVVTLCNG
jgi:hypothetical protein